MKSTESISEETAPGPEAARGGNAARREPRGGRRENGVFVMTCNTMTILLLPLTLLVAFITAGCELKFGDDVELSGAAFDSTKLAEVSTHTGVSFPPGARGVEYFYLGSGIDDALAAKIMIPDAEIEDFKANAVMTTGTQSEANIQIGRGKPWWKIDGLTDRVDRKLELPNAQFLEVTCGREGSDFIVYLSWTTT